MPRSCSVCVHTSVKAIDSALIENASYRDIAGQYGVSRSALERHRAHLSTTLVKAAEAEDVAHAINIVQQLKAINAASLQVLKDAREKGQGGLALAAVDRVQRQIELQAKLIGQLGERPAVNVLVSPEWLSLRGTILAALSAYPEARAAVAARLSRSPAPTPGGTSP